MTAVKILSPISLAPTAHLYVVNGSESSYPAKRYNPSANKTVARKDLEESMIPSRCNPTISLVNIQHHQPEVLSYAAQFDFKSFCPYSNAISWQDKLAASTRLSRLCYIQRSINHCPGMNSASQSGFLCPFSGNGSCNRISHQHLKQLMNSVVSFLGSFKLQKPLGEGRFSSLQP